MEVLTKDRIGLQTIDGRVPDRRSGEGGSSVTADLRDYLYKELQFAGTAGVAPGPRGGAG